MTLSTDTFRYLASALAQVFAAIFFGNCIFLGLLHAVVSDRREKYLEEVLRMLGLHAHDYIETPGVDAPTRLAFKLPVTRIGVRNSTFPILKRMVEQEIKSLKHYIEGELQMYSTCSRLKNLDTPFGKAIAATLEFDSAKEENLKYHWIRYDLCYSTLHNLHLSVLHVLVVPALLVCVFVCVLALTDTMESRGILERTTALVLAVTLLGIGHTVYMAVSIVRRTYWVTVQKEHEEQESFDNAKKEYIERMRSNLQEQVAAQESQLTPDQVSHATSDPTPCAASSAREG